MFRELLGRIDNVGRQKIDAVAMTHGLVREIGRQYDTMVRDGIGLNA